MFGFKYKESLNGSLFARSKEAYHEQSNKLDQNMTKFPTPTFMTKGVGMMVLELVVGENIVEAVGQDLYGELRSGYFLTLSEEWRTLDKIRAHRLASDMTSRMEAVATEEMPGVEIDAAQRFFFTLFAPSTADEAAGEYIEFWQSQPAWGRIDVLPEMRRPMTELFATHMLKLDADSAEVFVESSAHAWNIGRWIGTFDMLGLIPDKK